MYVRGEGETGLGYADVEKANKVLSVPYHELLVQYLENVISDSPFFDMDTFVSLMIDQWLPEVDEKECSPELLNVFRASNNFRTGMSFKPQQQSVPTRWMSGTLLSSDHKRLCAWFERKNCISLSSLNLLQKVARCTFAYACFHA